TPIGNLMADAAKELAGRVFEQREGKTIDICLLNYGGIRSIIPKGDVTTRTAFEIMPFDNRLIVAELNGSAVLEFINYIITEKKAPATSGLSFVISNDNTAKDITIGTKLFDAGKTYSVLTSDYLINGGDRMD